MMRTFGLTLACFLLLSAGWTSAQDWPQWRGPNRDNKVAGFTEPKTWPKELTKKWKVTVGIGESSPVLVGDRVYTLGRQDGEEATACLDAATGNEVWKVKYAAGFAASGDGGYPGPRSTPAVGEGRICTLGVNGQLICRDAASGKEIWRQDKGYPKFHTSASPIIANGQCIALAGSLTAFDLGNGKLVWSAPSVKAGYGSPVFMTVDGVKQIVTPCADALVGVDAKNGKVLWDVKIGTAWQNNYSTPIVDGDMVYYSITPAGKGKGGKGDPNAATGFIALAISKKGDTFLAKQIWKAAPAAGYHTPILANGRIFGVGAAGKNFFCLDPKTGEELWKDATPRGQCGSIVNAGSVLFALNADKDLIVMRPSAKKYEEVTKYRVSDSETWCVPIIAGNRVFVKDRAGSLTLWTIE
ncbi:MAG: PQQ-like beta-propeller repeat protein [Planctomycetes bacterium]|nr:PQQ-like beta-propeller repeat protein [Planctomycetota bacterium]